MNATDFTSTFLTFLRTGDHVLDIGGSQGEFAQKFVERGAYVTVVDPKAVDVSGENILMQKKTIEVFCAETHEEKYHAIFARNAIQFLDRSWVFETLLPWMKEHVTDHGVIAIETFYRDPEPQFARPVTSLYELTELSEKFISWPELLAQQYTHRGQDMNGGIRQFYTVDLIIQSNVGR